jgi:glycosyltransferase involved in cell wall biosynthesis
LGISRDDIAVLPNGHDHVRRWSAAASTIFESHRPRRPYVLLIGSRAKHKNILGFLLSMAPALDELGLDIWIAGGSSRIFAEIDIDNPPNVNWLGVVSDDDLAALYGGAFCLAFPSLTEGFGLPLIEAMALGCPVVASDRASMPEVCGDAALLADPFDPGAWLMQFSKLVRSPSLRSELVAKGNSRIADFTWTKTARGYREILQGLAA